jgi:hypothetical protein
MTFSPPTSRCVVFRALGLVSALAAALVPAAGPLEAQAPDPPLAGRWRVTFASNAYRYENGERVPVGSETWFLLPVRARGDSVVATWTSENGKGVDTLRGVVRGGVTRFAFDPRGALARPVGATDAGAEGPVSVGTLDVSVRDGVLTGTLARGVRPPGAAAPFMFSPVQVRGERVPTAVP